MTTEESHEHPAENSAAGLDKPEEKLTRIKFPHDQAHKYAEGLGDHDYALGEPLTLWENTEQYVYMDGIKVGTLHAVWYTPTEKVAKGIHRSLKPRIEYIMTIGKDEPTGGSKAVRYTSRPRAIFTRLSRERGIRI